MTAIWRDIACFLRSYVAQSKARQKLRRNTRIALGGIEVGKNCGTTRGLQVHTRSKATLGLDAFRYAVTDYWNAKFSDAYTLSFDTLAHEPGSLDKVFLLDEDRLTQLLIHPECLTGGVYA